MRALIKHAPGPGNVAIAEMPEPACGEGRVKIEVRFCGVCGTDLHVLHDTFRNYPPVILGHEFSGTVVETGAGVNRVVRGDGVTVFPASAVICGKCPYCRSGNFLFCPTRRGMGHGVNGAFTRYAVVREDQVYKIPEGFSFEEAALSEPFAAATHAVCDVARPQAGDVVLLSGPGPIGLMWFKKVSRKAQATKRPSKPTNGCRIVKSTKSSTCPAPGCAGPPGSFPHAGGVLTPGWAMIQDQHGRAIGKFTDNATFEELGLRRSREVTHLCFPELTQAA